MDDRVPVLAAENFTRFKKLRTIPHFRWIECHIKVKFFVYKNYSSIATFPFFCSCSQPTSTYLVDNLNSWHCACGEVAGVEAMWGLLYHALLSSGLLDYHLGLLLIAMMTHFASILHNLFFICGFRFSMLLWSITTISWNWMDITSSAVRQKHTKRFRWQLWIFGMQWYWASLRVCSIIMDPTLLINVTRHIIVQLCTSHHSKLRNQWFSFLFTRATSTK